MNNNCISIDPRQSNKQKVLAAVYESDAPLAPEQVRRYLDWPKNENNDDLVWELLAELEEEGKVYNHGNDTFSRPDTNDLTCFSVIPFPWQP